MQESLFQPSDPDFEQKVQGMFKHQPFMDFLGVALAALRPGYCEFHLPYREELSQQNGFFHAGVIGTLADNSGGAAAYTLMAAGSNILTVEYKLNLLAPAQGELLIARTQVIKPGRTLSVCRSDISVVKSGQEKLCATAIITLMALAGKPVTP